MKNTKMLRILVLALGMIVSLAQAGKAEPMGTAWTYQGRLMDANDTARGVYDMMFHLYDSPEGPSEIGVTDIQDVEIPDGYFTVELGFDVELFSGDWRWLEISIRPGDSNDPDGYIPLNPRQQITPTPYALYARRAGIEVPLSLTGSTDVEWIIGATNNGNGPALGGISLAGYGVRGQSTSGYGILGTNTGGKYGYLGGDEYGVYGTNNNGNYGGMGGNVYGVYGESTSGYGVLGMNTGDNYGYLGGSDCGVYGEAPGDQPGIKGRSQNGDGVVGWTGASNKSGVYGWSTIGAGVTGRCEGSGNTGFLGGSTCGAYGYDSSGNFGLLGSSDYGVYGNSNYGYGVYGFSENTYGVVGDCNDGYGVYGKNRSSENYGYIGSNQYGVYGKNWSFGNYGFLGGSDSGVYGYSYNGYGVYGYSHILSSTSAGVYGHSDYGYGVYGGSGNVTGAKAGYFAGNVYVTGEISAENVVDRTPYPKDLKTAYDAVMSMELLLDGQYEENNKEKQLDHSKLSNFIRSEDGNRDLSATVSCLNEVVKDLVKKVEAQQQIIETQNKQIQQMTQILQTNRNLNSLSQQEQ